MLEWIVTLLACFLVGGLLIMADRRWGERVLRTAKSLGREHPLTESLRHGFVAGKTPITRLIAAFVITMFLWYLRILDWVDVIPGFIAVALGMFLEPMFEWVFNYLSPVGKAINETVSSLEQGNMSPLSKASTGFWERIRKTWSAKTTPTASPKSQTPAAASEEAAAPFSVNGTGQPPVEPQPTKEEVDEAAREAFRKYVDER